MNTHTDKTQENKSQSVANAVSHKQSSSNSTFQFMDNRPEAIAQRKPQEMANNSPQVSQLMAFQEMANNSPQVKQAAQLQAMANNYLAQKPIQLKVDKYRAGAWYSTFDPYTTFWTKKEATNYDRQLKSQGRDQLRARVPTLYTYTHTKPANKLSHALQGPHTVAHRVILQALINATNAVDVFKIFDEQILKPEDAEEIVFTDEAPASGSFAKQIQDRLTRFVDDYESIYDELLPMFTLPNPDLIKIKHLTNMLLNMDPYAVYAWKTTTKASSKSLSGKGESVSNPSWSDMYDTPPSSSFKSQPNLSSFVGARQDLFNQHF